MIVVSVSSGTLTWPECISLRVAMICPMLHGELYSPLPLPCKAHMTSKECQRHASIAPLHWKRLTRPQRVVLFGEQLEQVGPVLLCRLEGRFLMGQRVAREQIPPRVGIRENEIGRAQSRPDWALV